MKTIRAKKILVAISLIILLALSSAMFFACSENYDVTSVRLTDTPSFVTDGIEQGDNIDFGGVALEVTYSNGASEIVDIIDKCTVIGFNKDLVGEQIITVSYSSGDIEKSVSLRVNVYRPRNIDSVTVLGFKSDYTIGSELDFTGAKATVVYDKLKSDGTPYTAEFSLSSDNLVNQADADYKYDKDRLGSQTLRFLLYDDVYATYTVTLTDADFKSVALATTYPTKTKYAVGDALDLSGLKLRLRRSDGVTEIVTDVDKRADGSFYVTACPDSVVYALSANGEEFDSSAVGERLLYVYFRETSSSDVLKTSSAIWLSVVDKDVRVDTVTVNGVPRLVERDVRGLVLDGATISYDYNDQTSVKNRSLEVTYNASLDRYDGDGFYITGYDNSAVDAYTLTVHFLKPDDSEYDGVYRLSVEVIPEYIEKIEISTRDDLSHSAYDRYIDSSASAVTFNGYVTDTIELDDYLYTVVYNSGRTLPLTPDDFTVSVGYGLSRSDSEITITESGTSYVSISYTDDESRSKTLEISVFTKTALFNKDKLIFTSPSRREYQQNSSDSLDMSGARLEAVYEDPDTAVDVYSVVLEEDEILPYVSGYDLTDFGPLIVTVTYLDAVRDFTVTVLSEVEKVELLGALVVSDYVKGTLIDRTPDGMNGISARLTYRDTSKTPDVVTDFSDAAWKFYVDDEEISSYPLADGLYSDSLTLRVEYLGIEAGRLEITVHNYVTTVSSVDASWEVTEGKYLPSDYVLNISYEDGSVDTITSSSSLITSDYNKADLTLGARTVVLTVLSDYTGGASVTTSVDLSVVEKIVSSYTLRLKSGETLSVVTSFETLSKDIFELIAFYNNDTSSYVDFSFDLPDNYDEVTVGAPHTYNVTVRVDGTPVSVDYTPTHKEVLDIIDGTLRLTVVYDVATSVTLIEGDSAVSVVEGGEIVLSDTPFSGWKLRVVYKNGSSSDISVVDNGEVDFIVRDFISLPGNRMATIVHKDNETVSYSFPVTVTEKVLTGMEVEVKSGSVVSIIEGLPLTDEIFSDVVIVLTYEDGSVARLPLGVNYSQISVDGYDIADRLSDADKVVDLTVSYKGLTATLPLTVYRKSLVGIEISSSPKSEYVEKEPLSLDGNVLLTSDGEESSYSYVYNNGDKTLGGSITVDMLKDFNIADFNVAELDKTVVVVMTVAISVGTEEYTADFTVRLKDRKIITVSYDSDNVYEYYYGVMPTIDYTAYLDGEETSLDIVTTFYGTSDRYVFDSDLDKYRIVGRDEYSSYLPAGDYTIVLSLGETDSINAFEDSSMNMRVSPVALSIGFDSSSYSKTYDRTAVTDMDSKLVYIGFADGETSSDITVSFKYVDDNGSEVSELLRAGTYIVTLIVDGEKSFLDNYSVTLGTATYLIEKKSATVSFYNGNSDSHGEPDRVYTTYGDGEIALGSSYYKVDGLIEGDTLDGELLRNQYGTTLIDGGETVRGKNVGYYSVSMGTLSASDYVLEGDFSGVYYVILPKSVTITLGSVETVYGSDAAILDGDEIIGSLGLSTRTLVIGKTRYLVRDTGILEETPSGVITLDSDKKEFTIGSTTYTIKGSSVQYNGSNVLGASFDENKHEISLRGSRYYYESGLVYKRVATLNESAASIAFSSDSKTYYYREKSLPEFYLTYSGLEYDEESLNGSAVRLTYKDGRFIDETTGLSVGFDVTFDSSSAYPVRVGAYDMDGTLASVEIANSNYKITAIIGASFTVTPKTVTITPDALSKVYSGTSDTDPELTFTVIGVETSDFDSIYAHRIAREEGESADTYAYLVGELTSDNLSDYIFVIDSTHSFVIDKKSVTLSFENAELKKEYDSLMPSMDMTARGTFRDADGNVWDGVDRNKVTISFHNPSSGVGRYEMSLSHSDSNHVIALDKNYSYVIETRKVEIAFEIEDGDDYIALNDGDKIVYDYLKTRRLRAVVTSGVVEGETLGVMIDLDSVIDVKDNYTVEAVELIGSNNYSMATDYKVNFSVVKKTVYVLFASDDLTATYGSVSTVRDKYTLALDTAGQNPLNNNNEILYIKQYLSVTGQGTSFNADGYVLKLNSSSDYFSNYNLVLHSEEDFLASDFTADGVYVSGHGGMRNSSLVFFVNKKTASVSIADSYLSKVYDESAPSIVSVSVDGGIAGKVKKALVYTRLTGPDADLTKCASSDIGTFSVAIDNTLLDGDAANYYCILDKTDYVYEINLRTVTVSFRQGEAVNIYRRYNGLAPTHSDVVSTAGVDYINREIYVSDYLPSTDLTVKEILDRAQVEFVFTSSSADVGTYYFSVTDNDVNRRFVLGGATDSEGRLAFEIRPLVLSVTVSSEMYRYYMADDKYYLAGSEIDSFDKAFEIDTEVYIEGTLTRLTLSDFPELGIKTSLDKKAVAMRYIGSVGFNMTDADFTALYPNYSLPSLTAVVFTVRPSIIDVTIGNEDYSSMTYGSDITEIEKNLLLNGKISYTLPSDVVYSGSIDVTSSFISVYDDSYYFVDGFIFLIEGHLNIASSTLTMGNDAYVVRDSLLYKSEGILDGSSLTVRGRNYTLSEGTFTDTELKSYYKVNYGSQLAGSYYPESGYIRLNGVGEFRLLDGTIMSYASCGELYPDECSIIIDGTSYAHESASGYVYRVDGRFNTDSGVFTIGSSRYIVSGEKVFEIIGETTSSSEFTLDGVTYSVSDGSAYKPTDVKGEKYDDHFTVGKSSYYWDASDNVYEIVGLVSSETEQSFTLNGKSYSNSGGLSYTMNTTDKTITVGDGAVYVYDPTSGFIRKSTSTSAPYTFAAAGGRAGNIISLDKKYVIVGDDIYLVEGTVTATSVSMTDFDYIVSPYGYIYMDTEATIGTVNTSRTVLTLGEVTYHISATAVYTTDSTAGTISTADREFILNNKTYVYPDSVTAVIAYDLSMVRFEYYDSEDNLVAMTSTTPVGEYTVRVVFDGIIENYVDNVRYTGNYTFVSDEKPFSVTKAPVNVTLSGSLDWTYRESPVEGDDFSALNISSLFTFTDSKGAPFDITGLYYPALTDTALAIFTSIASTDVVGTSYTLNSDSFERLDEINFNYSFILNGEAVINVVKRALTTTLVSVSATDNTVTTVLEKTYGTLPVSTELGILYTGFSDTEFDYAAVYYEGEWYVIYNYSATASVNSIAPATEEEKTLLDSVVTSHPTLPKFFETSEVDGVKYATLYSVGRNRIAIDSSGVTWNNYYADTPSAFYLDVTARPLKATLVPAKNKYEIIYGSTLDRGTDYDITFDGIVDSITVEGTTYVVDTADALFFDKKDGGFDWLVYAIKVNMKNDGTSVGQPVYITLGNSSTSKLEGLTRNYTLSYAVSVDAEICIYNKIESVMVGNGTLYSSVLSFDSYIPVRVFYLDGTESDIIKVYLNGTSASGVVLGESDGSFSYDDSVDGNQLVKISYSESNMGVDGGIDSASVFITLRKYPTSTVTAEDTSGAKEGYKKFAYYVFDKGHSFTVTEVLSHSGAIGLDYTGDGNSDIVFLLAALRTDAVKFSDGDSTTISSIDPADGSVIVKEGTKYYLNDSDGVTRLYANRNGSAPSYAYTGYVGQIVMERVVLATDGSSLEEKSVDGDETTSFDWSVFGFSLSFKPTEGQYAEIVASRSDVVNGFSYVDLQTLPDSLDAYKTKAVTLFNGYKLLLFRVGVTQGRVIYVSRDDFATHTLVYVDETEPTDSYSVGATDVFSGLEFALSSSGVMTITSLFKAIDPDYVTTGGEQYAFGTKKVLDDDKTYSFTSITAPGEYDRLRMEYSALPVQGKEGELNFVVFSYNSTDLRELSIRLTTSERAVFYVVESVNGKENLTRYEAYKDSTDIGYATMVDFFDGKVHYFDVYLNRLSNELTVIIDGVVRYTHSLLKDEGITLDGATITDVDFKLEDYSEWQDGDRVFYTERVKSEAYFTVKNLSFTVSSMRFSTLGYVNEMSATLIPSGNGAATLYVSEEEPLVWIDIAKYFTVIANYTDDTTIKYYVNGIEVVNYAYHLWLEEGLYTLTARLFLGDSVIAEADYSLFVKKLLAPETINGEEVSYVDPVIIEDAEENILVNGAVIKDYNYYRAAFRLAIADGSFDGSVYNLLLNIKSSEKGSTAMDKLVTGYYALTLGVKLGSSRDYTELVLSADDNRYTLYTYDIDWKVSSEYVVIAYMDDYNHVVTLSVYYGDNKSYTFKITKDSLRYGVNGSDIDTETDVEGYSRKSLDVLNFVESDGTIGFKVDSVDLQLYSVDTHTDLAVRESIYSVIGTDTTGTLTVTAEEGFNSRISPTTFTPASGQYQAIMIGDGSSRPYALLYNSYSAAFSLTRTTGVATARFIVAENLSSDLQSMYGAYRKDDNFTSTRSIALVYTDNGTVAELAFYFMSASAQGVYKQTVYSITDRTDARILSDGEVHTVAVNIFKTKESLSSGSLTTGDIAAFHVQVAVDGVLMTSPTTGKTASFYFPYYNSLAYWKVYSGTATTASDVDLNDKRFLNEYTMAGAVFENCSVSLYGIVVAQCDTLTVTDEFIENEVKGGNPDADNYYYFDYFSELCGLGGALRIAEEDRQ